MKKIIFILAVVLAFPFAVRADLGFLCYAQYGYSMFGYKSKQVNGFLTDYNTSYTPDQPFKIKLGLMRGFYVGGGLGIGDEKVQCIVDLSIFTVKSPRNEARFADGSGRDVWMQMRNSTTCVGVRFGGSKEIPGWVQFNMNAVIQHVTVSTEYVFPDGSRSMGHDHNLNGSYTDMQGTVGLGVSGGYRIGGGPFAVTASFDYTIDPGKKHPEYHVFSDMSNVDDFTITGYSTDFLPGHGSTTATPYLYNDSRGWKFNFGVAFILSTM